MDGFLTPHRLHWLVLPLAMLFTIDATAQRDNVTCGNLDNAYGPFDYTNPNHYRHKLPIVVGAHFTPKVENLIHGNRGPLHADLDYTLRAFPNHYRALNAMARYQRQNPEMARNGTIYTAECYFERAIRIKDDATVRMLYGIHLQLTKRLKMAHEQYERALAMAPHSPELNYNYGLLLTDLKQYELARQHAQLAYDAGYPLPGLKNRLRAVNQWSGP